MFFSEQNGRLIKHLMHDKPSGYDGEDYIVSMESVPGVISREGRLKIGAMSYKQHAAEQYVRHEIVEQLSEADKATLTEFMVDRVSGMAAKADSLMSRCVATPEIDRKLSYMTYMMFEDMTPEQEKVMANLEVQCHKYGLLSPGAGFADGAKAVRDVAFVAMQNEDFVKALQEKAEAHGHVDGLWSVGKFLQSDEDRIIRNIVKPQYMSGVHSSSGLGQFMEGLDMTFAKAESCEDAYQASEALLAGRFGKENTVDIGAELMKHSDEFEKAQQRFEEASMLIPDGAENPETGMQL